MTAAPEAIAAQNVRNRIAAACERVGRDPAGVTLVAATKTIPAERVLASGVSDIGENRVQEMLGKMRALEGGGIRWHFIGALQRNKVSKVAGRVALIHSVDSTALGAAIARHAEGLGIVQDVLVEVNLSGEGTKSGVEPGALDDLLAALHLPGLAVRGLMTIPAPGPAEDARPAYRLLSQLAAVRGLEHRSMGMSGDFEVAVEEGATIVRVGTAIFGERLQP